MTRLGWAVLVAVILALGGFVLWTADPTTRWERLWTGTAPVDFVIVADGREQRVIKDRVRIAGVDLPLDPAKAKRLWDGLALLSARAEDLSANVPDDALKHYGLDPVQRRIEAAGVRFSWGITPEGRAYVGDLVQHRVFALDPTRLAGLVARTGRLDRDQVIDVDRPWQRLDVDGQGLTVRGPELIAEAAPQRPPFTLRGRRLFASLARVAVRDLAGVAVPTGQPAHRLSLEVAVPPGQPAATAVVLRLWPTGDGGVLAVDGYPAQRVDAVTWAEWTTAIAAFSEDRLFNLDAGLVTQPVESVNVQRGGRELFSLRRRGFNDINDGRSQWDVVWEGGREPADPLSPLLLLAAFNELAVRSPRLRTAVESVPLPAALVVTLNSQLLRGQAVLEIAGDTVRSPSHVATVARLPDLLAGLRGDRFLDLTVVGRSHQRAVRFQREGRGAAGEALAQRFDREANGTWIQVQPQARAVDQLAVDRLVRALCQARALSAHLVDADDRARVAAQIAAAELTVALRFAAKPSAKADDAVDLDETVAQDLGLAFVRAGESSTGSWTAYESTGTRAWVVDADLVETLRASVDDPVVLPVAATLVGRIEFTFTRAGGRDPADSYSLLRRGDGWVALRKGVPADAARPAKDIEVRRLFRLLGTLRAEAVVPPGPGVGRIAGEHLAGTLFCELPGLEGDHERLTVEIGVTSNGRATLHTESSRQAQAGIGRGEIAAGDALELLPPYERFVEAVATPAAKP